MAHELQESAYASAARGWNWLAGVAIGAAMWGGLYCAFERVVSPQFTPNAYNAPLLARVVDAPEQVALSIRSTLNLAEITVPQIHGARVTHAVAHRAAPRARMLAAIPVSVGSEEALVVRGVRPAVWVRTPSAWRISAAYPARALEAGRQGEASLHCNVRNSGALNCVRTAQTDASFGDAALRVARMFKREPRRADETVAAVNLHIVFRLADDGRALLVQRLPA